MSPFSAKQLPELRSEICDYAKTGIPRQIEGNGPHFVSEVMKRLHRADLFYIAEPMVDLCQAAKETLPSFSVEPEDVPVRTGLCYFAQPMSHYGFEGHRSRIVGVAWTWLNNELVAAWLADRDYFIANGGLSGGRVRNRVPRLWPIEALTWDYEDEIHNGPDGFVAPPWGRQFVKSAWLLMQQPIVSAESIDIGRSARRRITRRRDRLPEVRVVTLRRAVNPSPQRGQGESDREYHHRWIVRGHWRQHWYPKRGVHRPVWIAPHLKGPDDKPLIGGEKVHAWIR